MNFDNQSMGKTKGRLKMKKIALGATILLFVIVFLSTQTGDIDLQPNMPSDVALNEEAEKYLHDQANEKVGQALKVLWNLDNDSEGKKAYHFLAFYTQPDRPADQKIKIQLDISKIKFWRKEEKIEFYYISVYDNILNIIVLFVTQTNPTKFEWAIAIAHESRHAYWNLVKSKEPEIEKMAQEEPEKYMREQEFECWLLNFCIWREFKKNFGMKYAPDEMIRNANALKALEEGLVLMEDMERVRADENSPEYKKLMDFIIYWSNLEGQDSELPE